jgi:hypothetical protein
VFSRRSTHGFHRQPTPPLDDPILVIQPEKSLGDPSFRRERPNDGLIEEEMLGPLLSAGVEERDERTCQGVKRTDIGSLEAIAGETGQSQVVFLRLPSVLPGHDVIWLMLVQSGRLG